jgi:ATP-dependent RNA helicase SUPV3L1/SUV3
MPISFPCAVSRDTGARGAGVTAVLGPTNTGKTHLAIERMLGHSSGIIGLPLRLLAREVYNKVAERVGGDAVALITGEEKIKPPNPRYWVSTVEAMPRDLDVAFLAIDEVQLGADLDRGHVFTDRMLNRRGREETLVLGAQTVRPMVERLLPGAHVLTRPRLSQLSFAGERKITRLPRRSAVVAFSAEEVYSIAELIRRQRGGAAVVLGALSPRTRNAQVELYQSGDVEYLVATDAIGMGLNLDVDHIAFASDRKFDGYQFRRLNPAELAQIAGRAGRATRNGTFGTTGRCPPFETELAQALESHSFEPIKVLQWRNTALDFSTIGALQASLAQTPKESSLTRAPIAEDILVLEHAVRDDDIRALAKTREAVERLWDVCQVPDYRKISPATHAELATTLYEFLMREGAIPIDWFARQVEQADHADGDIDTLSNRIAHIRTWTFAANRPDWLADPEHWQGITHAIEDKLSDALHERLTERFVDRRTSVLMRRLRENTALETDISKSGEVVVEGHTIGRLDGFMFTPESSTAVSDAKALASAAQKALAGEINARAKRLAQAADGQFVLSNDETIRWLGQPVARLMAGDEPLKPRLRIICDEHLTGAPRDGVQGRLELWLKSHIERVLEPLFRLAAADDVTGIARGVAYQLIEALGVLDRQRIADEVKGLDQATRATLRKYGVRFGAYHIYVPSLLKPAPRLLSTQLWALKHGSADSKGFAAVGQLAASGRTSIAAEADADKMLYRTAGYRVCGARAVRVDILERLADLIRPALAWRASASGTKPPGAIDGFGFTVTVGMTSLAGCSGEDFASVLRSLGYRMEKRSKPVEASGAAEPVSSVRLASGGVAGEVVARDAEPDPAGIGEAGKLLPESGTQMKVPDAPMVEVAGLSGAIVTAEAAVPSGGSPSAPALDTGQGTAQGTPQDNAQHMISIAEAPALAVSELGERMESGDHPPTVAPTTEVAIVELIEVWRPTRRDDQRSPRRQQSARRGRTRGSPAAPSLAADAASREGTDVGAMPTAGGSEASSLTDGPALPEDHTKDQTKDHTREHVKDGADGPRRHGRGIRRDRTESSDQLRSRRSGRPDRRQGDARMELADRSGRSRSGERAGRSSHSDRPERDPALRAKYIKGRVDGSPRREQEPDPNSPFAKLSILKEQLEAGNKEPR